MTQYKNLKPKDVIKLIEKNGWIYDRSNGSHYIFKHNEYEHSVIVPYHNKPLKRGTLHNIIKDARI